MNVSELIAQQFRALPSGVCLAERTWFKSQTDHKLVISKFHLVLYTLSLSSSASSFSHEVKQFIQTHISVYL